MKSSANVYLVLCAVVALLLWGILAAGARLQAPPHLAGQYHVDWEWEIIPPRGQKLPDIVHVDQSGLFLTVTADDQILSRGQLHPPAPRAPTTAYTYQRDSDRWPLDISEVSARRMVLALADRSGFATRQKGAPKKARPAPATYPASAPATRKATPPPRRLPTVPDPPTTGVTTSTASTAPTHTDQ